METINGYHINDAFTTKNAGFCKWAIGEKDGRSYFIKEFLTPKYPADDCGLQEPALSRKRAACQTFFQQRVKVYRAIQQCRTGNIVIIRDFFREGSKYYAVTERINPENLTVQQIADLPPEKKWTLIRSLLYSFSELHGRGVVHSDIKPDNILLKKTEAGFYTGKIIDFDASFLEWDVPEDIQGDQVYLAPEVRLRMMDIPTVVTTKADIFALGILFHQYWCGEQPAYPNDYGYLFEAVLDGATISVSERIPNALRRQIQRMLQKDPERRPSAAQVLHELAADSTAGEPAGAPPNPPSRVKFHGFSK